MRHTERVSDISTIAVTEPNDPRIEVFQGLRDKVLRQKREAPGGDMQGVFIAEGDVVINRALAAGYKLQSVLVDAKRTQPLPVDFENIKVYAAAEQVLEHIAGYRSYRGALGCFYRKPLQIVETLVADTSKRTFVIVEGINNPTNLGTIMRCAAGLSVDALLLSSDSCDPLSRRCCRVSMGEGFEIPYAWIPDLVGGLAAVKAAGIEVLAMTPLATAVDIASLRYGPDDRVALLLGAEGPGLTEEALTNASHQVKISMSGNVDSMNVGNAAAIAFYAVRQSRVKNNRSGQLPNS
jgi:tRNA G18 (ribose-2'-O)-methylase SpoU